ncbi:MAG: DUF4394 domain-containing protein [Chthonomonas sp.]|nr:DUF4394 domain-containing protein [Chthonomonas sp.]
MKTRVLMMAVLGIAAAASQAATVFGLSTRNELVRFDSATPGTLQQASFIQGLASNESLVGMDFRPANGTLYGVGSFGRIYTINTSNGMATFVSSIVNGTTGAPISLMGTEFGIDFNPVPDRLRITSNLGQNLRINVATGGTTIDGTLNQAVGTPYIVASAYTNSFAGATTTTLYNIDSASDMLTIQTPPNNGTQVNVGMLGMNVSALAGMDILTVGSTNTAYAALQVAGMQGSRFAMINLATGAATDIGMIGMEQTSDSLAIRDIAVMPVPEPASVLVMGLGAAALLLRRRR